MWQDVRYELVPRALIVTDICFTDEMVDSIDWRRFRLLSILAVVPAAVPLLLCQHKEVYLTLSLYELPANVGNTLDLIRLVCE